MFTLIIEEGMEHHLPDGFFAACENVGVQCKVHTYLEYRDQPSFFANKDDLISVWGSIKFVSKMSNWLSSDNYFSSFPLMFHYYHLYQHRIPSSIKLNTGNVMLPFSELKDRGFDNISQILGGVDSVFFRPDQALKICEAAALHKKDWEEWLLYTESHTGVSDTTLFWISKGLEGDIKQEYRCVVESSKVLSVSSYGFEQEPVNMDDDKELVDEATKLASLLNLGEQPYVMDLAQTPKGLKVIEINCLSTSGMYKISSEKLAECWHLVFQKELEARL
tara:strand:- start:4012 stop:4842 length:831 start_codon:yes stop_codon:yes gene_type:complete